MDALLDFEDTNVFHAGEAERIRLPRRIVKDRLDLFLSLTEEEFTFRFNLSKHTPLNIKCSPSKPLQLLLIPDNYS